VHAVSSTETKISNSKEEAELMVERKAALEAEKKALNKRVSVMEEQVKKAADEEVSIQAR
jgi:regulator of replication initiation timing